MSVSVSDELITDKGIYDTIWCPVLWRDENYNTSRVKPYRDFEPLEEILWALRGENSSRWVVVEEVALGWRALPGRESFWLHIPHRTGKFLLVAHQITWAPMVGSESTVTVERQQRYEPRDDEAAHAERMLQVLMARHVAQIFYTAHTVRIITRYPVRSALVLTDPTDGMVGEAEVWAERIQAIKENDVFAVPRYDHCWFCWWKQCPERKVIPAVPSVKFRQGSSRARGSIE